MLLLLKNCRKEPKTGNHSIQTKPGPTWKSGLAFAGTLAVIIRVDARTLLGGDDFGRGGGEVREEVEEDGG